MQMVFQNPFDTLNPSHTVGSQLARVIRKFGVESDGDKIERRVMELLDLVKLPREFARRRPRQLSGGQKRSEEHTSELQSLMRISYAVFCLKKKKNNKRT